LSLLQLFWSPVSFRDGLNSADVLHFKPRLQLTGTNLPRGDQLLSLNVSYASLMICYVQWLTLLSTALIKWKKGNKNMPLEFFVSNCLMTHFSITLIMTACKCRQRYSANMFSSICISCHVDIWRCSFHEVQGSSKQTFSV
jgi:hypothetical protein